MTGETPNPLQVLREHLPTDYLGPDPNDLDGEKWGQHPEALAALAQVQALVEAAQGVMTQMDYETPHHTRLRAALVPFAARENTNHQVWCATNSWFGEKRGECDCRG